MTNVDEYALRLTLIPLGGFLPALCHAWSGSRLASDQPCARLFCTLVPGQARPRVSVRVGIVDRGRAVGAGKAQKQVKVVMREQS